jgi:hypothetical protein
MLKIGLRESVLGSLRESVLGSLRVWCLSCRLHVRSNTRSPALAPPTLPIPPFATSKPPPSPCPFPPLISVPRPPPPHSVLHRRPLSLPPGDVLEAAVQAANSAHWSNRNSSVATPTRANIVINLGVEERNHNHGLSFLSVLPEQSTSGDRRLNAALLEPTLEPDLRGENVGVRSSMRPFKVSGEPCVRYETRFLRERRFLGKISWVGKSVDRFHTIPAQATYRVAVSFLDRSGALVSV